MITELRERLTKSEDIVTVLAELQSSLEDLWKEYFEIEDEYKVVEAGVILWIWTQRPDLKNEKSRVAELTIWKQGGDSPSDFDPDVVEMLSLLPDLRRKKYEKKGEVNQLLIGLDWISNFFTHSTGHPPAHVNRQRPT